MSAITSSTVDDIVRRSAARHPDRVALVFDDRTWTYAALDDAVSRAAAHLLGLGLDRRRPGRDGRGQLRRLPARLPRLRPRGPRPRADQLRADRPRADLPARATRAPASRSSTWRCATRVEAGARRHRPRAGAAAPRRRRRRAAAAGARATCPRSTSRPRDTDLVQLLYTSGTTSQPKGAMMTHRGARPRVRLRASSGSTCARTTRPLHSHAALPLGPDARLPAALPRGRRDEPPADAARRARRSSSCVAGRSGIGSLFLAPTVWVPLSNHPALDTADLGVAAQGVLRRVDHAGPGARPAPASACPDSASRTASASPRSARSPRCCAPRSTPSDPRRAGAPCSSSRRASSTPRAATSRPASRASCSTAHPSCAPATGTSRTRRPRPSATAGSTPATS